MSSGEIGADAGRVAWWSKKTVAVVTGGNKGIGYEVCRGLAQKGLTTILTARSEALGQAAADKLNSELPPGCHVSFVQCDITDQASVERLRDHLHGTYGGLDILLNNAGMAYKGNAFGPKEAEETIATNVLGTMRVCNALVPLLRSSGGGGGRIVNACSMAGALKIIKSPKLKARWEGAVSQVEVETLCEEFVHSIERGSVENDGWPGTMYGVSKLGACTYTRVLARELEQDKVIVSAVCPGYCATDMSSWRGTKTAAQGADTVVWCGLAPVGFETGQFWTGREKRPW